MAKYLYNNVELPEIPERDSSQYPYTTIIVEDLVFGDVDTHCFFSSLPFAQISATGASLGNSEGDGNTAPYMDIICYKLVNGVWEYNYTVSWSIFAILVERLIYTNYDLYVFQTDTLILPATDPVPVGGEPEEPETTLTARDLYKKVNGKPVKLTLYKKVDGKLVALDEYSAVSATAVQSNT